MAFINIGSMEKIMTPIQKEGYLGGQLLLATPQLDDSCFRHSLICLCAHSEEGAMGINIAHPLNNIKLEDILKQLEIKGEEICARPRILLGGPVEISRGFILHSNDFVHPDTLKVNNYVSISSNLDILRHIIEGSGPIQSMLALGYASWSPGQLEQEIKEGSWLPIDASFELLFEITPENRWQRATKQLGFDIHLLSHFSGSV